MDSLRQGYYEGSGKGPTSWISQASRESKALGFDQYKVHSKVSFEGHYNRIVFPSGSVLILIFTHVLSAKPHQNHITIIFVPADSNEIFREELWPPDLLFRNEQEHTVKIRTARHQASLHGYGLQMEIAVRQGSLLTTEVGEEKVFAFTGFTSRSRGKHAGRVPWFGSTAKPEGYLSYLPLPLHWYVHTLGSDMLCTMQLPASFGMKMEDRKTIAKLHAEKNWAHSFPSAHIWITVREELPEKNDTPQGRGLCLAGGQILGMQAFLVGFYDDTTNRYLNFRPPFALRFLGISPFMSTVIDWKKRLVELSFSSFTKKVTIKACAPKETFFGITAPFHDGFRENWLAQSMKATIEVETWKRRWWIFGGWIKESSHVFQRGALEFGGDYYDDRGVKQE